MEDILYGILTLVAGCGVFMIGMKLMGDGLERGAGGIIRKIFAKISDNRTACVGIGAGVTAIVQSSSATTVMVIGFVNAGVMSLFQATAIIMGANIGTTVTGILVSLKSLPIAEFAAALSFIGIMLIMFSKKDKLKHIGTILAGVGLLFVGLDIMGSAFKSNESISSAFSSLFSAIDMPILLILFGAIFTAVIQSSSAATGVVLTLVTAGVLGTENALYIILGTNIGTCITALLASMGASTNAKRAALVHLTFNLIGTLIFTILILIFHSQVVNILGFITTDASIQIAIFHVCFNVITTLLLLPFVRQLTWLAIKVVKEKDGDEDALKLYYIDDRILSTPAIAVAQVVKEVENMLNLAKSNLERSMDGFLNSNTERKEKVYRTERKINFINKGISKYLVKLSSRTIDYKDEKLVGSLFHVINDVERIGDHAKKFMGECVEMKENDIKLSSVALAEIKQMYDDVITMYTLTAKAFSTHTAEDMDAIDKLEDKINEQKASLNLQHIERLNSTKCDVESGIPFYATLSGLERVGDHLYNIAGSVKKSVGASSVSQQHNDTPAQV